jgi:hypothetical protein
MKSMAMGFALAVIMASASTVNAAFLTKGSTSVAGNNVNYAVKQVGVDFHYFYQIDAPVVQFTKGLFVASNQFESASLDNDLTINLAAETIDYAAGSTQNKSFLVFDPNNGAGIGGFQVGSRPTELLTAISKQSWRMGTATINVGGVAHSFSAPVPVPVPPAFALVALGLPFVGMLRRKFSRK